MAANASPHAPRDLSTLVRARARLLHAVAHHPSWAATEARIAEGLRAHFANVPPALRRIDASTSHTILNQIIHYEAVHEIRSLRELWRRLEADRRCYALFGESMPDEPLVFTEVALTSRIATDVGHILDANSPIVDPGACTCAMFYSISSCHEGLRGVPLGGELIRRVLDRLQREWPRLRTFATVSPVPGFRPWLTRLAHTQGGELRQIVTWLDESMWLRDPELGARVESALLPLCASYLIHAKRGAEPLDAVARFHLGNGARLERINWLGDRSAAGLARSAGITANYVYDPSQMDSNHDIYGRTRAMFVAPQVSVLAHDASAHVA
jgi:malonyl-CoA decarboxylase